jgi:hypothetical protein
VLKAVPDVSLTFSIRQVPFSTCAGDFSKTDGRTDWEADVWIKREEEDIWLSVHKFS